MRSSTACLLLVAVSCLLVPAFAFTTRVCPKQDYSGKTVTCYWYSRTADCYGSCCLRDGQCPSSSCVDNFNLANDQCNPASQNCKNLVSCKKIDNNCKTSCLGRVNCDKGQSNCAGRTQGQYCLFDGNSQNFKTCGGGSEVIGDPQFLGLRGQDYQVHGVAGEIYNIVSDPDFQYNSRFVFLNKGECPVFNGKKQKGCFSHPGSYLGELGLLTKAGDKIHIASGPAKQGFKFVKVNDQVMDLADSYDLADGMGSVSYNTTHFVTVNIGQWSFEFENSDKFVNEHVRVQDLSTLRSHGLLGQTHRGVTYRNAVKHIEGTVDDYMERNKDLFGSNYAFSVFA